jgi:putative intracellular protease/amidase
MAVVLIPLPALDFDPTEVAVSWRILRTRGHEVVFATPDGSAARADDLMVTGRGLDPWGWVPLLRHVAVVGRALRANADGRTAHAALVRDPSFGSPVRWVDARETAFVAEFFAADKPVAAVCHGVLLAARSRNPVTGTSVLYGRRTTALTWPLEHTAWSIARRTRFWDPSYYRTYPDGPGRPPGFMSVQQEVTRALARPEDFVDVPADAPDYRLKTSGRARDTEADRRPGWVVRDGTYLSARWPGDVHTFAHAYADMLGGISSC